MASLFRFFAFALFLIGAVTLWAFIDYRRNKRKALAYFRNRLGFFGKEFAMTRFVNMARVSLSDPERFIAAFFLKGKHLEIRDFSPDRVMDISPDTVVLSDSGRNFSWIFTERKKLIFSLRVDDFVPRYLCYVKRGTGGVKFGEDEIPASNKDWFLIDRANGRSFSPPLKEADIQKEGGFFFYDGLAPTEGFLLDEHGGILLIDENNGTIGFRESAKETIAVYGPDDIVSAAPSEEDPDIINIRVKDNRRPEFSFEFDDAGQARYWVEWLLRVKKERSGKGITTCSRFVKIPQARGL